MKKYIKIFLMSIILLIVIFFLFKGREYIDAHTEFKLNENTFILDYIEAPKEGGYATSNNYYEINLEKNIIDYRYDYTIINLYVHWFKKAINTKKRKLVQRYYIDDDTAKELRNIFTETMQTSTNKAKSQNNLFHYDYYLLISNKGEYYIEDQNQINNINNILNNIKKY